MAAMSAWQAGRQPETLLKAVIRSLKPNPLKNTRFGNHGHLVLRSSLAEAFAGTRDSFQS